VNWRRRLPQALALLGDLTGLRVRAEVDERDVGKIKLGSEAVVRADARFAAASLPARSSRSPAGSTGTDQFAGVAHPRDSSVSDVLIELSDPGPLLVAGMRGGRLLSKRGRGAIASRRRSREIAVYFACCSRLYNSLALSLLKLSNLV
jgi:hypothetical protein